MSSRRGLKKCEADYWSEFSMNLVQKALGRNGGTFRQKSHLN